MFSSQVPLFSTNMARTLAENRLKKCGEEHFRLPSGADIEEDGKVLANLWKRM
jgi:hypothetical protein